MRVLLIVFCLGVLSACDGKKQSSVEKKSKNDTATISAKPSSVDNDVKNEYLTISAKPKGHAWWLRAKFNPIHKEVRGLPVNIIDGTWRYATELRKEYIPPEYLVRNGADSMQENNSSFSVLRDYNNDGRKELAVVGVYSSADNQYGRFLLILDKNRKDEWRKSYLRKWPGDTRYLAISTLSDDDLNIWFCMYCGHGVSFTWDKANEKYKQVSTTEGYD